MLATGGYREVKIWRLPDVAVIAENPSPGDYIANASSPDGKWRALGLADGSIKLFNQANPWIKSGIFPEQIGGIRS